MLPSILEHVQSLGYAVFTEGIYNLNIIGLRTPKGTPDAFDDWMVVVYQDEDGWVERWWPITTEPGLYYLQDKSHWFGPGGVSVLVPGQYRGAYVIGLHKGYEALVQWGGPVKVYLDADLDAVADCDPSKARETSTAGINIHASTMTPYDGKDKTTLKVGPWSGGCQVFADESDFRAFMALCKKQVQFHPTWKKFTYTLIDKPSGVL